MTQRLDEIIDALEKGKGNLDETLKLYEEGVKLADACEKYLSQARAKIEILTKTQEGIRPEPFLSEDEA